MIVAILSQFEAAKVWISPTKKAAKFPRRSKSLRKSSEKVRHLEAVESALEQAINESAKPEAGNGMHLGLSENVVYPYTQWFCWSLSLLNGYNWGYTPFSDIPIWKWPPKILQRHFKAVRRYGCSMVYSQQHIVFFCDIFERPYGLLE